MADIPDLINGYYKWLREKTQVHAIDDWHEITTPFLDRHNDYIQIYAKKNGDQIILSDDGYTISDLEASGLKLDNVRRKALLDSILNGFGVKRNGSTLTVLATEKDFPIRKHNFIQSLLSVNDMFYLSSAHVASFFFEDVAAWLDDADVRFAPNVKFAGKSGFDHLFNFVIPKSKRAPERLLRAVTKPSRAHAENFSFAWYDTRDNRPSDAEAYAILNDEDAKIPSGVLDALRAYEIKPILWSQREEYKIPLAS